MLRELHRHPDSPSDSVERIEVEIQSSNATLSLLYRVTGRIHELRIPRTGARCRADELWKHTCFEAFLKQQEDDYLEFNFSPSTEWAAYAFDGYRQRMQRVPNIPVPVIGTEASDDRFELRATLTVEGMGRLRIGLSAVVEEIDGNKSYWALAHAPGRPDFHHPDCFALELPPASGT